MLLKKSPITYNEIMSFLLAVRPRCNATKMKNSLGFLVRLIGSYPYLRGLQKDGNNHHVYSYYLQYPNKIEHQNPENYYPLAKLLLMVQKSGIHQLRLVVYPIIYKVWDTSKRWLALGFLPSTFFNRLSRHWRSPLPLP